MGAGVGSGVSGDPTSLYMRVSFVRLTGCSGLLRLTRLSGIFF